ncbi:SsgA family sporulation/cell division regulator [Nonomuraea phyllanthi]|uniref:SsgA family sporulation/cell division regulator n=1 Tax=Nonomuraea phyllanthi TaxID=2219224 RepID=UPI001293D971|nr:SsgA family sporulation/cell division regulator [Nonomuraea phyllanthi]QFY09663.1 SsgA family sporulation/cell division regulator [Nonomuraea phyllanthi]
MNPEANLVQLSNCLPMWQADNADNFLIGWLHYRPADPWFVQVYVSGGVVTLDVPRDVLLKGLDELAACEDLKVQPSGEPMWTLFTLRWNPDEPLTFRVPTANLRSYLAETAKLVPYGGEETRIDWDSEITELFEEAQEGDIP